MIWPFKRKPKHVGPTSVDWKPGDWAECVTDLFDYGANRLADIQCGDQAMVSDVCYGKLAPNGDWGFGLMFVGRQGEWSAANAFRKITLSDTGADRKVGKRKPVEADA